MAIKALSLLIALCLLAVQQGHSQNKHAFVAGVADYDQLEDLQNTVNDARAYAEVFEHSLGFRVTVAPDDATELELLESFSAFLAGIQPGDDVVFIFSGHGWSNGIENYLIPSDVPHDISEHTMTRRTLALGPDILDEIKARKPGFILAIIDACRDNPFNMQGKSGFQKGLVRTKLPSQTLIVYAAEEGRVAYEALGPEDRSENSIFTRSLLPLLGDADRPLLRIVEEAGDTTAALAASVGRQQFPAFYSARVPLDFCFSRQCNTGGAVAVPAPTVKQEHPSVQQLSRYGPAVATALKTFLDTGNELPLVGVAQDFELMLGGPSDEYAADILQEGCELGSMRSCTLLAELYAQGMGVPKDETRAASLARQACDKDDMQGCLLLANWHLFGGLRSLEHSGRRARDYLLKAKRLGQTQCTVSASDWAACSGLASVLVAEPFFDEITAPKITNEMRELLERACGLSRKFGCSELATALFTMSDVPGDKQVFERVAAESCDLKNLYACSLLAEYRLMQGDQTQHASSIAVLEDTCSKDDARACYLLADLELTTGDFDKAAIENLKRSCELLYSDACAVLGLSYSYGLFDSQGRQVISVDAFTAIKFLRQGCELGNRYACRDYLLPYKLGQIQYTDGSKLDRVQGVPPDLFANIATSCTQSQTEVLDCETVGLLVESGLIEGTEFETAKQIYEADCARDKAISCGFLGVYILMDTQNGNSALSYLRKAQMLDPNIVWVNQAIMVLETPNMAPPMWQNWQTAQRSR